MKNLWKVTYNNADTKLFDQTIFIYGTEEAMWEYTESEFGYTGKYTACTPKESNMVKALGLKIYIA